MTDWCEACQKETVRYSTSGACRGCVGRKSMGLLTPEQHSEMGRKGYAAGLARMTAERRAAIALTTMAKHGTPDKNKTPEKRRDEGRRAYAATLALMSSEQRRENGRKGGPAGGYRSGRVRLGKAITRKTALVEALEAELQSIWVPLGNPDRRTPVSIQ